MADQTARYRFRGNVKPTAEAKRPVRAYRNADAADANGAKSSTATIDIFDVIDSWGGYWGISAGEVDQALAGLGDGVDTLYVRVNSPGGEATEGIAIANLLRAHAATIHVTNYGLAASAASVIAIAGDTLAMAPGSLLMIHKAWNYVRGNADDIRDEAAVLDKFDQSLAGMYALKGGADTDWLALMGAETWMTPEDAVEAGLADTVGIETGPTPVNPDDQAEPMPDVDGDTPFDRAARVFDLSVFDHAPAAFAAHKPPAEPPEKHPSKEGAVVMTDTEIKALRERLGLAEDADVTAINAKLDELEEQATKPGDDPTVTDEAVAKAWNTTPEKVKAAREGKADEDGMVTVPQAFLDSLKQGADDGKAALARQRTEDREKAIAAAQDAGKIGRAEVEVDKWRSTWDRNPDDTAKWMAELPQRFPVTKASGYAGSDGSDGTEAFDEEHGDALAGMVGLPKGSLR